MLSWVTSKMAFLLVPFTSDSNGRTLHFLRMGGFATSGAGYTTLRMNSTNSITFVEARTFLVLLRSAKSTEGCALADWCVSSQLHFVTLASLPLSTSVLNPFVNVGIISHHEYPLPVYHVTSHLLNYHIQTSWPDGTGLWDTPLQFLPATGFFG